MKTTLIQFIIIFLGCFVGLHCTAQNTTEIAGARHGALSNTGMADSGVWQNLLNPAGILVEDSGFQAGAAYTNRFTLNELSSRDLVGSVRVGKGRLGFVVHSFGYEAFRQNQISAGYAMKLSDNLRAGIQLNYFNVAIAEGFGNYSALTGNIGFQYDFNERITVGLTVKNPNRSSLSTEVVQQYVQSIISGGVRFAVAENMKVLADISKDIEADPNFSTGLEYTPLEQWHIRGGISTQDRGLSFGFGYESKKWSLDLASLYHQVLGFSPMVSFTYRNE